MRLAGGPALLALSLLAPVLALMNTSCGSCGSPRGGAGDAGSSGPIHAIADMSEVLVLVGPEGFRPSEVRWTRGTPLSLVFRRTSDSACGNEVTIPDLGITRALPLNEKVEAIIPGTTVGRLELRCGTHVGHVIVH